MFILVLVHLSAHFERFSVSCMHDYLFVHLNMPYWVIMVNKTADEYEIGSSFRFHIDKVVNPGGR